jgi:hypothetical protein
MFDGVCLTGETSVEMATRSKGAAIHFSQPDLHCRDCVGTVDDRFCAIRRRERQAPRINQQRYPADNIDGWRIARPPRARRNHGLNQIRGLGIPVSDVSSTRFYTEIVGCRHLATVAQGTMAFLDAAGTCLILVKREPPINPRPEDHGGVHHSFGIAHDEYSAALDHLRLNGVEITFEEDRRGGSLTARAPISTTPTARSWNSSI